MKHLIAIRKALGQFYGGEREYHSALPPELNAWHCYTTDGGHSIMIVLPRNYSDDGELTDWLCPAPVKAVLRQGYDVKRGYVVCNLPYSASTGLICDADDDEF